jgi:hypothetical protein
MNAVTSKVLLVIVTFLEIDKLCYRFFAGRYYYFKLLNDAFQLLKLYRIDQCSVRKGVCEGNVNAVWNSVHTFICCLL